MDLVLTGVGLLLLLPMWRYVLKRSLLDSHRDKLFDLRDELRDKFHSEKWDMASPVYRQLRDLVNGYLRYTEHFQYSEFLYIEVHIRKNPELQATMKERFERNFAGISEAQLQYVMKLRGEARRVMMSHMILSSFPLAIMTLLLFPIVGIHISILALAKNARSTGTSVARSAFELRSFAAKFIRIVIAKIARLVLVEELVEEYSYRQGRGLAFSSGRN